MSYYRSEDFYDEMRRDLEWEREQEAWDEPTEIDDEHYNLEDDDEE